MSANRNIQDRERIRIGRVYLVKTPASPNWYAEYCDRGKQHRHSLKTRSKKQATSLGEKLNAQVVLGELEHTSQRALTIEAAIPKYLNSLKSRGLDPSTIRIYGADLAQFMAFAHSRRVMKLEDVKAELLETFAGRLVEADSEMATDIPIGQGRRRGPNKPRTVRAKLKTVRQLIRWSLRRNLITSDPSPGYQLPPLPRGLAPSFTPEQVKAILRAAPEPYRSIYAFLSRTGLRSGELRWLTPADIDEHRGVVLIRPKTCPVTGCTWRPKHGRERAVPLPPLALRIASRAKQRASGPWLFPCPKPRPGSGGRYSSHQLLRPLKRVLKRLGIKNGVVHSFRHFYITQMVNSGVNIFALKRLVGHEKITTLEVYYHHADDHLIVIVRNVDFKPRPRETEHRARKSEPDKSFRRRKSGPGLHGRPGDGEASGEPRDNGRSNPQRDDTRRRGSDTTGSDTTPDESKNP